jgi:hypothetical protein
VGAASILYGMGLNEAFLIASCIGGNLIRLMECSECKILFQLKNFRSKQSSKPINNDASKLERDLLYWSVMCIHFGQFVINY